MKIQKKHAVSATNFITEYVEQEFYPMDEAEAKFIGKAITFGIYHNILTLGGELAKKLEKTGVTDLPGLKTCARLDVGENEANFLVEMIDEFRRFNTDGEQYESLRKYLVKELCSATD